MTNGNTPVSFVAGIYWWRICSAALFVAILSFYRPLLITPVLHVRYKFDDERVTKEELKRALEEQYGGEEEVHPQYAYLLVMLEGLFV
jgi:hypothetical protein